MLSKSYITSYLCCLKVILLPIYFVILLKCLSVYPPPPHLTLDGLKKKIYSYLSGKSTSKRKHIYYSLSFRWRCIVMFLDRWLNFTSISFFGLRERCQYLQVPTGLGSTTPAVYTALTRGLVQICTQVFLGLNYFSSSG